MTIREFVAMSAVMLTSLSKDSTIRETPGGIPDWPAWVRPVRPLLPVWPVLRVVPVRDIPVPETRLLSTPESSSASANWR